MPIYEFHCKKCGKDSEILTASTNWKGTKCPNCASEQLVKKLSVFATSASESAGAGACEMPACGMGGGCCGGGACGMN
jgi:putative FmdB family regulatory protein